MSLGQHHLSAIRSVLRSADCPPEQVDRVLSACRTRSEADGKNWRPIKAGEVCRILGISAATLCRRRKNNPRYAELTVRKAGETVFEYRSDEIERLKLEGWR